MTIDFVPYEQPEMGQWPSPAAEVGAASPRAPMLTSLRLTYSVKPLIWAHDPGLQGHAYEAICRRGVRPSVSRVRAPGLEATRDSRCRHISCRPRGPAQQPP